MTDVTDTTPEAEGATEGRVQSELTRSVGTPMTRRAKSNNFKLSTWKWRFGFGRKPE